MDATEIFIKAFKQAHPQAQQVSRVEIISFCEKNGLGWPSRLTADRSYRISRGLYRFVPQTFAGAVGAPAKEPEEWYHPAKYEEVEEVPAPPPFVMPDFAPIANLQNVEGDTASRLIPTAADGYVQFGHYRDVRDIVRSGRFYPSYITGLSGNGKTMMVEQVHAETGRKMIRVNVTIETDEDDLLGGFRLVDGETVWQDGPVVIAMTEGATLLLDEIDLGSNRIMCLQPVLEGRPIYLKKVNRTVKPAPGFNVIATANTKGKGSDDGRFIGTNVMNEALLDRFAITFEQEYPAAAVERKILSEIFRINLGLKDLPDEINSFCQNLVEWAGMIRTSFNEGAVTEVISTRRLVNICEAYMIFKNREKAVRLCLARFDPDTKNSFMDFYGKIDRSVSDPNNEGDEADIKVAAKPKSYTF